MSFKAFFSPKRRKTVKRRRRTRAASCGAFEAPPPFDCQASSTRGEMQGQLCAFASCDLGDLQLIWSMIFESVFVVSSCFFGWKHRAR
jgi:hypothetical protein